MGSSGTGFRLSSFMKTPRGQLRLRKCRIGLRREAWKAAVLLRGRASSDTNITGSLSLCPCGVPADELGCSDKVYRPLRDVGCGNNGDFLHRPWHYRSLNHG